MSTAISLRPQTRWAIRAEWQSALIAGAITGACLVALPVGLIEVGAASLGLSEKLTLLAPPIGWGTRIALALAGAIVAAGLSLVMPGKKRNGTMSWAQSLGLRSLVRMARGETEPVELPQPVATPRPVPAPRIVPVEDILPRRRADQHPDAPPRAPLMASRDLPAPPELPASPALTTPSLVVPELTLVEAGPETAPPPPTPAFVSPIRDTTAVARPRPLPRSPDPLSEADLSRLSEMLSESDAPAAAQQTPATTNIAILPSAAEMAALDGVPLKSLVDRFEQGVDRRIAVRDATNAIARVDASLNLPTSPLIAPEAISGDEAQVDEALEAALATLRKLSAGTGR